MSQAFARARSWRDFDLPHRLFSLRPTQRVPRRLLLSGPQACTGRVTRAGYAVPFGEARRCSHHFSRGWEPIKLSRASASSRPNDSSIEGSPDHLAMLPSPSLTGRCRSIDNSIVGWPQRAVSYPSTAQPAAWIALRCGAALRRHAPRTASRSIQLDFTSINSVSTPRP